MRRIGMVVAMVAVAALFACGVVNAAPVLQVDFNDLHSGGNWAPPDDPPAGWLPGGTSPWGYHPDDKQFGISWDILSFTQTLPYGVDTYMIQVSAPSYIAGFQNSVPYYIGDPYVHQTFPDYAGTTLGQVYRDGFAQEYGSAGDTTTMTISGLAAHTNYNMTVWSWNKAVGTTTFKDALNSVLGSVDSAAAEPDDDADYSAVLNVTTDDVGAIVIKMSGTGSGGAFKGVINGFSISEAGGTEVPEPATLLLVGTGALGVFGYIRRRKMA